MMIYADATVLLIADGCLVGQKSCHPLCLRLAIYLHFKYQARIMIERVSVERAPMAATA